jgi:hypothetical protein
VVKNPQLFYQEIERRSGLCVFVVKNPQLFYQEIERRSGLCGKKSPVILSENREAIAAI